MSGPVDHRAEAVRLARKSEETIAHVYGQSASAAVLAHLSEVHAGLACAPVALEDERAAEAESRVRDLESDRRILHGAVQDLLAQAATGPDEYWAAVDRLRALVGDEPQLPPDPPRKPSAKFHKQGTVIPPVRKP